MATTGDVRRLLTELAELARGNARPTRRPTSSPRSVTERTSPWVVSAMRRAPQSTTLAPSAAGSRLFGHSRSEAPCREGRPGSACSRQNFPSAGPSPAAFETTMAARGSPSLRLTKSSPVPGDQCRPDTPPPARMEAAPASHSSGISCACSRSRLVHSRCIPSSVAARATGNARLCDWPTTHPAASATPGGGVAASCTGGPCAESAVVKIPPWATSASRAPGPGSHSSAKAWPIDGQPSSLWKASRSDTVPALEKRMTCPCPSMPAHASVLGIFGEKARRSGRNPRRARKPVRFARPGLRLVEGDPAFRAPASCEQSTRVTLSPNATAANPSSDTARACGGPVRESL